MGQAYDFILYMINKMKLLCYISIVNYKKILTLIIIIINSAFLGASSSGSFGPPQEEQRLTALMTIVGSNFLNPYTFNSLSRELREIAQQMPFVRGKNRQRKFGRKKMAEEKKKTLARN